MDKCHRNWAVLREREKKDKKVNKMKYLIKKHNANGW